ncbi:mediator of RNA polymerase II transcription subunit 23 isoform X2 [Ananas comosus]|uniref:Mediator of RNA polymerase II transcription subunit 23 isoform X2 n=1 Tax=Ananas comosus TaxID=4615 RepID=A0A6P5EI48_ANACO|nr:mediator of RNA polymerase II transcription subunit 23 isoform X2 [Ananas comosus]
MEQNQRGPRPLQLHPARSAIVDLFNLYLGRNSRQRPDDPAQEAANKMQKRVTALNRELPPHDEQFVIDFEQLQGQFPDQEQLRAVTESVLISFVVQCSSHAPQSEFLLFAIRSLCSIGYLKWDSFLPSLLSAVSSVEASAGQGNSVSGGVLSPTSSAVIPNASNYHASNPASPLSAIHAIGSPAQSTSDQLASVNLSPAKPPELSGSGQHSGTRGSQYLRGTASNYLRQLSCRVILMGLESNLKPITHFEIFQHMVNWLVNWDQRQQGLDESDGMKNWKLERPLHEWMHLCLDVLWTLVAEDKCRIPFYELLRSSLQFMDNIPDDEVLFSMIMEIHKRRDMVAMHMQMLDQHLHCPTFATHRFMTQSYPAVAGEPIANLRYSPITYPSVLGEPLHGEDLANSIPRGSLDWERALRCLRHALRTTPSPDWWRRVLLSAPCYRPHTQQASTPGAVFSPEMIGEAVADRTIELLKMTNTETQCWLEWLLFADIFFFLMKSGCIDFLDFVDKLASRVIKGDQQILRSNHVTWLLAQIIRIEIVMNTLSSDPRKVETTRKIISFHKEDKNLDSNNINPQNILLDFISSSQTLRIWSFNTSIREHLNSDQLQKGRQIDEWWKQMTKGERMIDFMNLDDRSMGMFWVLSFTMAQPACEAVMNWFTSAGVTDLLQASNVQTNERVMMMRETYPLSMSLLSGLSINLCLKLAYQLEEAIFLGQAIPSIAMVETYVRLLLIAPHSLFRPHFTTLTQRSPSILSKSGVSLLLLEILNYRLLPLYRYHGKSKALMYDVTKIISMIKGKRGEHRLFRLAENLCMNLILSIRDFFMVKKELKGPTEFTETLNRITIISLAITIKTRGIAEVEHMIYLQPLLDQIMATSQHTWSEKTLRFFPPLIRDSLIGRIDKRGQAIQAWQQAETTVINQCTQLLSPSADPTYVMTYLGHSFPQHRQYLCAGAWMLMNGHPESINSTNLGRVLREFSPEEVTSNIYTMVDVLLHHIQVEMQRGHLPQDLLSKAIANLVFFIWTHELLPLDILLLALIDRDDDHYALRIVISLLERPELQKRIKMFCSNRSPPEHWLNNQPPKRVELQHALGNHLSWKDRYPVFFDDIAARLLPVIPLIIYRLIENDATDISDRVLAFYSSLLNFHPLRFTFVRDILAYFYGHLPSKLIVRILKILDISKIPFSDSFPQHVGSSNPASCPPLDYFANLLLGLVNNVIPSLNSKSKSDSTDSSSNSGRAAFNKSQASPQSGTINNSDGQKAFYQNQDPGSYTQLVLETAAIEILSLPASASQIVSSLVQVVVHVQSTLIQSSSGLSSGPGQNPALPTSPSGGSAETMSTSRSTASPTGINCSNFVSRSGYSCQQLSCLMIQACGLLLAQLPPEFHVQLYSEASRIIKDCWWLADSKRSIKELDSAVGYALLDPTWASQDNTSTAIGNIVALLHAFFSNLPQEWLESTHTIIKHLRPVTSVAMLRIAFRILGPLLPRLAFGRPFFMKTLALLFNVLVDVFGKNSQSSAPTDVSEIADLIDFLHHAVMYEGQGGPVQSTSKPKSEILTLCGKVTELLKPDVQHLLSHLKTDLNSSIYAATHPKLQNPA